MKKSRLKKNHPKHHHIKRHADTIQFLKEKNLSTASWYLVIGPQNSGKSTLLKNSELTFSLEKKVADTSNMPTTTDYDWWVTRQSVFIDMPGNHFTTSDKAAEKRQAKFLNFLQKKCYAKMPAGIILVLSIEELLNKNQKSKASLFHHIKQQLKAISLHFKQPIPLLITMNKCDLVTGFREFFGELSRDERRQIWGISFNQKDNLLKQTQAKLNHLIKQLNRQLIWRLQHEYNIDKRALINDFTLQFKQIRQHLIDLLKNINNKSNGKIYIKGLFLTAATQKAAIMNIFNQAYSSNSALINTQQPTQHAYFIHDLLNNYLPNITSDLPHPACFKITTAWPRHLVLACASLIIMAAVGLSIIGFKSQISRINKAQNAITSFQIIAHETNNQKGTLKTLRSLKEAANAFNSKKWSLAKAITPHQATQSLRNKTTLIYQHALKKFVLPRLTQMLNQALTNDQSSNHTLYTALQSYLMLTNSKQYNNSLLNKNLQTIWNNNNHPNQPNAEQLNYFHDLINRGIAPIQPNTNLIATTRYRLNQMPAKKLSYIIFQNHMKQYRDLSLNLNANSNASQIFTFANDNIHINSLYTATGFKLAYPNLMKKSCIEALKGNWVLGNISLSPQINPALINSLVENIKAKYLDNYANAWLLFLNNIKIINFAQLNQLNQSLSLLTNQNSLLAQLANLMKQQIVPEVLANNSQLNNIISIFTNKSRTLSLNAMLHALKQLQAELSPITQNQKAFQLASYRMRNNGSDDAIEQLFSITARYPQPIKNWLNDIASNAWQTILLQAQNYINEQWRNTVFTQYESQLNGRFPFNINSNSDVSLKSFTYFFAPNGLLDKFFSTYLSPFINTTHIPWHTKNIDGNGLQIANATLHQLQNIHSIQHAYFKNSDPHLFIPFTIQPKSIEDNIGALTIQLGSQSTTYQNKKPYAESTFIWPDDTNTNLTEVTFANNKNQQQINIISKGPWGLFKLLNEGHLSKTDKPNTYSATLDQNGYAAIINLTAKQKENPFSLNLLNGFKLPQEID